MTFNVINQNFRSWPSSETCQLRTPYLNIISLQRYDSNISILFQTPSGVNTIQRNLGMQLQKKRTSAYSLFINFTNSITSILSHSLVVLQSSDVNRLSSKKIQKKKINITSLEKRKLQNFFIFFFLLSNWNKQKKSKKKNWISPQF